MLARRISRRVFLALVTMTVAALALLWRSLGPRFFQPRMPERLPVRLLRVADGDTLHLQPMGLQGALQAEDARIKVRLVGIDAPELGDARGFRAALALAELCEGARRIELEAERRSDGRVATDKYGRTLGWLWVEPGPRYLAGAQRTGGRNRSAVLDGETGKLVLAQEVLVRLQVADLYEAAANSKHYARLVMAQRHSP